MRKMTVIAEVSVRTLVDLDVLEDLIEDVILEALHQDEEVEVKVTAEFVKVPIESRPLRSYPPLSLVRRRYLRTGICHRDTTDPTATRSAGL